MFFPPFLSSVRQSGSLARTPLKGGMALLGEGGLSHLEPTNLLEHFESIWLQACRHLSDLHPLGLRMILMQLANLSSHQSPRVERLRSQSPYNGTNFCSYLRA